MFHDLQCMKMHSKYCLIFSVHQQGSQHHREIGKHLEFHSYDGSSGKQLEFYWKSEKPWKHLEFQQRINKYTNGTKGEYPQSETILSPFATMEIRPEHSPIILLTNGDHNCYPITAREATCYPIPNIVYSGTITRLSNRNPHRIFSRRVMFTAC